MSRVTAEVAAVPLRWADAQAAFARAADNRKRVVADGSSQDIAHDRPDLVLAAIADMLGARPA